jgi:glycosyltransferase involved in cell wall biosynthesis
MDSHARQTAVRGSSRVICYLLGKYRSHHRAGLAYRKCLVDLGVTLTDDPELADIVIIHDDLHNYPRYFQTFPILHKRYVIAYAVWELSVLPEIYSQFLEWADEIWTCSKHCRSIFSHIGRKVTVVPHVVDEVSQDRQSDGDLRVSLGAFGESFLFYTIGRWEERKNIAAAIRAFKRAFASHEQPIFVVKTTNAAPAEFRNIPNILLLEGYSTDGFVQALHRHGNCFVSSHCAEGWGLCISDAMTHGNLVVATGYSGNMQYMTGANSLPVSYAIDAVRNPPERLQFGFGLASSEAKWAYVDEDDLPKKMKRAFHDWDELQLLRRTARRDMRSFSSDRVASIIAERLKSISDEQVSGSRRSSTRFLFDIEQRDHRRPLAFMHVPKAAGTSLMSGIVGCVESLSTVRGFDCVLFGKFGAYSTLSPSVLREVHRELEDMPENARLVMGHFALNTLVRRYPDAQRITFLREPISRLLSHWIYWRGLTETQLARWGEWAVLLTTARESLKVFLSNPQVACQTDNVTVRMLLWPHPKLREDGFIEPQHGSELADEALKRLGQLFSYCDVLENPSYLTCFQNWLGSKFVPSRLNETKPVPPGLRLSLDSELDNVTMELVEARTCLDSKLWLRLAAHRMPSVDPKVLQRFTLAHSLERFGELLAA